MNQDKENRSESEETLQDSSPELPGEDAPDDEASTENQESNLSESTESGTLNQDEISRLLEQEQNQGAESATLDKTDSTTPETSDDTDNEQKDAESKTLDQDDISGLMEQARDQDTETAPENLADAGNGNAETGDASSEDAGVPVGKKETEDKEKPGDDAFQGLDDDELLKYGDETGTEEGREVEIKEIEEDSEGPQKQASPVETEDSAESKKDEEGPEGLVPNPSLLDKKPNRRKGILIWTTGVVAVILLLGLSFGLFLFKQKQAPKPQKREKTLAVPPATKPENRPDAKMAVSRQEKPEPVPATPLQKKLIEAADLRKTLLIKQDAIADLSEHYENGIGKIENEILEDMQNRGITIYEDALKIKRIELCLRTIQRRRLYIDRLKQLFEQLVRDSEELLYLYRQAETHMQMVYFTQGMDTDELGKAMDAVIRKHLYDHEKLTMDTRNAKAQTLKTIWKNLYETQAKPGKQKVRLSGEEKLNRSIWKEICSGNFNRKYQLTALSQEAAKCLSGWDGKDLNLGRLTRLSPGEASWLAQWQGKWLSLNGLTQLSPETAKSLSRWRGEKLSLNCLKTLSSEAANCLSQWKGKELELISLKNRAQWKPSGKKIHLSAKRR